MFLNVKLYLLNTINKIKIFLFFTIKLQHNKTKLEHILETKRLLNSWLRQVIVWWSFRYEIYKIAWVILYLGIKTHLLSYHTINSVEELFRKLFFFHPQCRRAGIDFFFFLRTLSKKEIEKILFLIHLLWILSDLIFLEIFWIFDTEISDYDRLVFLKF